ncbi:MAG: GNAT family N-acetyltransferase [Anaerolineaceae bacterium]|nr:GNAT family N-acetyltransferase [Anaerolineaceae bacterium]
MSITIKEVTTTRELKSFIRFPHSIYKKHPYWVPALYFDEMDTLHWNKNPAFEHCEAKYWLAFQDGKIVGRIAGILNHKHIEKWGQKYLRFGWVDFIEDEAVSTALFNTLESWAKEKGMNGIHGPLGFTDLDREGMLIEGFDELGTLATIYNHAYYPAYLERYGFTKDIDWMEYEITSPSEPNETITRVAKIALKRNNLALLNVKNKKELMPYAKELFELLDEEYAHLYGTVPLTEAQVEFYIKQYFGFIKPDFVPVVLDQEGKMVAFGITMPSFSKALQKSKGQLFPFGFIHFLRALNKNDRADLYLIAVKKEYQGKGVNAILMDKISETFIDCGIIKAESNPELETNLNVQGQWRFFDTRQHKRRRCFIKNL